MVTTQNGQMLTFCCFCIRFLCVDRLELQASQMALVVTNSPASAGDIRDMGSIPGSGRSPEGRARQPTPVFLLGKFQGQRSLAGYNP